MNVVPIVEAEYKPIFDEFWRHYPRKVAKKAALMMWLKMEEAQRRLAVYAVLDHAKLWRLEGREASKIPHASTWLNGERFLDEIDLPKPAGAPPSIGVCGHSLSGGHMRHSSGLLCMLCWDKR